MGSLVYATNTSLDGFTEDSAGSFDWSVPDENLQTVDRSDPDREGVRPRRGPRLDLDLVDERRFDNGAALLAYRVHV